MGIASLRDGAQMIVTCLRKTGACDLGKFSFRAGARHTAVDVLPGLNSTWVIMVSKHPPSTALRASRTW